MTFVVTDSCIKCKFTDCVEVCPVDAFHEGENMLVINPDVCISCSLCEPECPIDAIVSENEAVPNLDALIQYAEEKSAIWPVIVQAKDAYPDAKVHATRSNKWDERPQ